MRRKLSALLIFIVVLVLSVAPSAHAFTPMDYNASQPQQLSADMLFAEAAVLMDMDTGDVLYGKDENRLMHPASTTKIMTLLLALESGIPLEQEIAIPQAAGDVPSGSSLIPVYPGETMTFGDLLKGFQVHSGNDGGLAIAVLVSGTVDNFVSLMNRRAGELGLRNTHYSNPHGYTQDGHYSTAYDLALLTRHALQREDFRELVRTYNGSIYVNERGSINLYSKTFILKPDSEFFYEDCIGVKTGSTNAAGECFVGAAERDGATVISVVLKTTEDSQRWIDTTRLFDFGWTCYEKYTLDKMYEVASSRMNSRIANCVVSNASEEDPYGGRLQLNIAQISDNSYLRMIERNSTNALETAANDFEQRSRVVITHDLTAPISTGEIIGDFSYTEPSSGKIITAKLVAARDVAERKVIAGITDIFPFLKIFSNRIFLTLLVVLALIFVLILVLAASRRAAKQRRRRRIYEQRREEYMRRQQAQQSRSRSAAPSRSSYAGSRPPQRSSYAGSTQVRRASTAQRPSSAARNSSVQRSTSQRSSAQNGMDRRRPR